jgi:hypothetical protein
MIVAPLTLFLAKLIGIVFLVGGLSLLGRRAMFAAVVDEIERNRLLVYVAGFINLGAGTAIVLGHDLWNSGTVALIVTLIGWVLILRGLLAIFAPPELMAKVAGMLRVDWFYYTAAVLSIAVGAYLSYAGFVTQ